jgi:ubiquitin thioesterase protein OTUB1
MDLYSAFIDSEDGDFIRWCERNVEAVSVDADQVQMIALSRSIGIPLTIANLGSGECETDLSISTFEVESIDNRLAKTITLLYRPGHYDLLYK